MPRRAFANEAAVMAASFPQYRDECLHGAPHSSNPIAGPVMEMVMGVSEKRRDEREKGSVNQVDERLTPTTHTNTHSL